MRTGSKLGIKMNARSCNSDLSYFSNLFLSVGVDQAEKKVKHFFSEPWEDSDVILVVENETFHVHRLILSMNSPVEGYVQITV